MNIKASLRLLSMTRFALAALMLASMTACGQSDGNSLAPYVKQAGWSSVCLGVVSVDFPKTVEMADSGMSHRSGYGFDDKFLGAASGNQRVGDIEYQETTIATLKDLQSIKGTAKFRLIEDPIIWWRDRSDPEFEKFKVNSGEVPLNDKRAYAFRSYGTYDIGYLDPTDRRIRLFNGALRSSPRENYTVAEHRAFYQHLRNDLYRARAPEELPAEPGVCTPFGLFRQFDGKTLPNYNVEVPIRSLKYPSLVFFVHVQTPSDSATKDVKDLPDPNHVTIDDIKSLKGMGAVATLAAFGGIKRTVGPEPIILAGQPGRLLAREYHHKGSLTTSSSGAAYEMQADVVGVQGRRDMPAITIKMAAALPDPDPLPPPTQGSFGEVHHYKPKRPALKGVKTPPFEEGMAYFRQVLASVRPLPALTGVPKPSTPTN